MLKKKLVALFLLCALPFCAAGCAEPVYPENAYENHPVADLFFAAEDTFLEIDEKGARLSAVAEEAVGLKEIEEEELRLRLKNAIPDGMFPPPSDRFPRYYYWEDRVFEECGEEVNFPAVYLLKCASYGAQFGDMYPERIAYAYIVAEVRSYRFQPEEEGWRLIAQSNLAIARVRKTAEHIYTHEERASVFSVHKVGPYFDDAVSAYLRGETVRKDMRFRKFALYDGDSLICEITLSRD